MIKYLLVFILLSTQCLAGMGIGGFPYPGPGVIVASGGGGSITVIQDASGYSTSIDTLNATISPTAGNALIVVTSGHTGYLPPSDNIGTTYNMAQQYITNGNDVRGYISVYYAVGVSAGVTAVSVSPSWGAGSIVVLEVSGLSLTSVTDASSTYRISPSTWGTTWSTGTTGTLSQSVELAVVSVGHTTDTGPAWSGGSGYTPNESTKMLYVEHKITTTTSGVSSSGTVQEGWDHGAGIITFKAAL